jgi:hypothetical protein
LILTRLGNPLVGGPEPLDPVAVGTVVAICSLPAPRAIGHVGGWLFRWRVVYLSILAWCSRRAWLSITSYLVDGTRRPKLIPIGSGEPSSVPFWLTVLGTMMREYGLTEAEAMAYPAGAAVWMCIPVWESGGGVKLISELEMEVAAELRADVQSNATSH